MLFASTIDGFSSWEKVFQSIAAWSPLMEAIYKREDLPYSMPKLLTPGSNAVFRVGQTVIKIFAPPEAEMSDVSDYANELKAHQEAEALEIHVPKLIRHGVYEDRYPFEYIIMTYIPGKDLGLVLPTLTKDEQDDVLMQIRRDIVDKLHTPSEVEYGFDHVWERALTNSRWSIFSNVVQREVAQRLCLTFAEKTEWHSLRVHGDMTGENLLIDDQHRVYLIDFADSCYAPLQYDYVAIALGLFNMDKLLAQRFFAYTDAAKFMTELFPFVLLHDFGAGYLRDVAARCLCLRPEQVECLSQLEACLIEHYR